MIIRLARQEDAQKLLDIYAYYVLETPVTFEYEVPAAQEFAERILHIQEKYPYYLAEEDGHILGYTYASAFKMRAAYAWSAETSIYVERSAQRKGVGSELYRTLEGTLARQNICNLCACIAFPNPGSIAFHESVGYRMNAHFHQSGYKGGKWYDMVWMEKTLNAHTVPPSPFIPFPLLGKASTVSQNRKRTSSLETRF